MELAKKFRYFEFQKKSMERKAMIIKDGYYFSLWDAVRITQIGHKWAGYTGERGIECGDINNEVGERGKEILTC